MFGYGGDEIVGQNVSILFTPDDRAAGVPAMELEAARRQGRSLDERQHLRKDGTLFYASGVTSRLGQRADLGFAKIARDLTSQRETADALRNAHAQLEARVRDRTAQLQREQERVRGLLSRVVTAQESERARIARDLHDQLGQELTALRLTLERAQDAARDAGGREEMNRALELTTAVSAGLDFLAWELRPTVLDDLGLAAALPRFVQRWASHYGVQAEVRIAGFTAGDLTKDGEVAFYRVAQESLNNVLKHAHASRADVVLETRDGKVTLVIADDGVGFDPVEQQNSPNGIGLAGMGERAAQIGAELDIESSAADGTTVYLRCPARGSDDRGPQ
jgi:PAS domain S-box-containing protein